MLAGIRRGERPEDVALRYMRGSPPTDLMGLAAELGVRIEYADLDQISGKIEKTGSHPPEFLVTLNNTHSENRQRFTLAHELAHAIKHRDQLDAGGIVDNALYRSLLPEPMEWEANRYAAQLLMPLSAMQKLWRAGHRTAALAAPRLGVSEAAALIRLDQLRGTLALTGSSEDGVRAQQHNDQPSPIAAK